MKRGRTEEGGKKHQRMRKEGEKGKDRMEEQRRAERVDDGQEGKTEEREENT